MGEKRPLRTAVWNIWQPYCDILLTDLHLQVHYSQLKATGIFSTGSSKTDWNGVLGLVNVAGGAHQEPTRNAGLAKTSVVEGRRVPQGAPWGLCMFVWLLCTNLSRLLLK